MPPKKQTNIKTIQKKKKVNNSIIPFLYSPEIEKENKKIRELRCVSEKPFAINLLNKIDEAQRLNILNLNKDHIKLSFNSLLVENDYLDNAKMLYWLDKFKEMEMLSKFEFDGTSYKFYHPNIEKIQEYITKYNKLDVKYEKEQIGNGISLLQNHNNTVSLYISNEELIFRGKRAALLSFFYNSEDRKVWKIYSDIKKSTNQSSHEIRQAIMAINKRCRRYIGTSNQDLTINPNKTEAEKADVLIDIANDDYKKYDPSHINNEFDKNFFQEKIDNFSQLMTYALVENYKKRNS